MDKFEHFTAVFGKYIEQHSIPGEKPITFLEFAYLLGLAKDNFQKEKREKTLRDVNTLSSKTIKPNK